MKRPDPGTPPELTLKKRDGYITQQRSYKLITPLFGGGVEPQQPDPITVVRATSIRGQLRFWWRATRGGAYATIKELKDAEDKLWGAASSDGSGGPSKVEVSIHPLDDKHQGTPFRATNLKGQPVPIGKPESVHSYVAFPLRDKPELPVLTDIQFTLMIAFPTDYALDIEATLWAWESFGGIGARTRRGFGAIQLLKITIDHVEQHVPLRTTQETITWLDHCLNSYVVEGIWPPNVPHLRRQYSPEWLRLITASPLEKPLVAWRQLFDALKSFRQNRNGRYGRSRWPEPETIRYLARQRLRKHQPVQFVEKFPRAAFGLPIVFEFKDRDKRWPDNPDADPKTLILQGMVSDRFASPLIIRPLAINEHQAIGVALILEGTRVPLEKLQLKGIAKGKDQVRGDITPKEVVSIPTLNGKTDVLRAFLDYLEGAAR